MLKYSPTFSTSSSILCFCKLFLTRPLHIDIPLFSLLDAFEMTVMCDGRPVPGRQTAIQGHCATRVRVIVDKTALGDVVDHSRDGEGKGQRVSERLLAAAIERLVRLCWRQNQLSGEVPVQVPIGAIGSSALSIVLLPELRLTHATSIVAGGDVSHDTRTVKCRRNELLRLAITVANLQRGVATRPTSLSVLATQTAETGSLHPVLADALQPIGATAAYVPALQPGETFRHTVGFVCLARGRYILSYMCESRRPDAANDDMTGSTHHWGSSIDLVVDES